MLMALISTKDSTLLWAVQVPPGVAFMVSLWVLNGEPWAGALALDLALVTHMTKSLPLWNGRKNMEKVIIPTTQVFNKINCGSPASGKLSKPREGSLLDATDVSHSLSQACPSAKANKKIQGYGYAYALCAKRKDLGIPRFYCQDLPLLCTS